MTARLLTQETREFRRVRATESPLIHYALKILYASALLLYHINFILTFECFYQCPVTNAS